MSSNNDNTKMDNTSNSFKDAPQVCDNVFDFFMKLFFYQGLVIFLPFLIINVSYNSSVLLDESSRNYIIIFEVISLLCLFIMDNYGIRSSHLDRISRLITVIVASIGGILCFILFYLTKSGWNNDNKTIVLLFTCVLSMYELLGWFFVRAERGLISSSHSHYFKPSLWVTIWASSGGLLLLEYFLKGSLLIGLGISFIGFPIVISLWGRLKVVPIIKPHEITIRYKRLTLYNFIIDFLKATAIILTIVAIIFNGKTILYPENIASDPYGWVRNLSIVAFVAAAFTALFIRIKDAFNGLLVIIIVLVISFVQFMLVYFGIESWWLISSLNGIIIAGIFYFIEQKMDDSDNVRAMPGSFYFIIFSIVACAIILRRTPELDQIFEIMKGVFSLIGLAYIFGYIREAPKQNSLRMSI